MCDDAPDATSDNGTADTAAVIDGPPGPADLLASERRRIAVCCLCEFDDPLALADLADEVATRERDAPITDVSAEAVKRVYVSLYHTHVPKLDAADVVAYDQDRDVVALDDGVERLAEFDPTVGYD